jgi:hypothetical protein
MMKGEVYRNAYKIKDTVEKVYGLSNQSNADLLSEFLYL